MKKSLSSSFMVLTLIASLSLSGCKDGNLFGSFRDKGSGDPISVLSDARAALANRDFQNAKTYYESVLIREPRNGEALYGAAVATMGTAGLNLGQLLSNVVASQGSPASAAQLKSEIRAASFGAPGAADIDPRSLLNGLDLTQLDRVIDRVLCYFTKIRVGASDGSISKDDIDVLINLGITCLLRAVLRPLNEGIIDIRATADGQDYQIVIVDEARLKNACQTVENSAKDIAAAFQVIKEASNALGQRSGDTVFDIRFDLNSAFADFKTKINNISGIPAACTNFINSIDLNTFDSFAVDPNQDCFSL